MARYLLELSLPGRAVCGVLAAMQLAGAALCLAPQGAAGAPHTRWRHCLVYSVQHPHWQVCFQ